VIRLMKLCRPWEKWTISTLLFSLFSVLKRPIQIAWPVQHRKAFLLCLLLFGLVFWVFLPSLYGDFIECDDGTYVTGNSHLQFTPMNLVWALSHGEDANWHPLTQWSFMFDHRLYGLNPWGYHLTNVLLHAGNSVLLFLVLRRMTGATWRSLMVACVFGLHPLRVESVAWISERKDVLSVWFWLWALWAYVRYAQSVASRHHAFLFYGLALVFFALGLMSKPMVVTLPGVLLLLDFWPLERWRQKHWLWLVMEKSPFLVLSAILSVVTFVVQKNGAMMKETIGISFHSACVWKTPWFHTDVTWPCCSGRRISARFIRIRGNGRWQRCCPQDYWCLAFQL
jgi:hypothetical protein